MPHFRALFVDGVKCRKLSLWYIVGHNLWTTYGNSDQILGFLDWFYIRLVYFSEKNILQFWNWKIIAPLVSPCLKLHSSPTSFMEIIEIENDTSQTCTWSRFFFLHPLWLVQYMIEYSIWPISREFLWG